MSLNKFEIITRHGFSAYENTFILNGDSGLYNGDFKYWNLWQVSGNIAHYGTPGGWHFSEVVIDLNITTDLYFLNGDFSVSGFSEESELISGTQGNEAFYSFLNPNGWVVKHFSVDNHGLDKAEESYCELNPDCDYDYHKGDERELYPSLDLQSSNSMTLGSELVSNGDFASDISGWHKWDASTTDIAWHSGTQRLEIENVVDGEVSGAYTSVATQAGEQYLLTATVEAPIATIYKNNVVVEVNSALGHSSYSKPIVQTKKIVTHSFVFTSTKLINIPFVATSSTTYIIFKCGAETEVTGYVYVDDVSVKPVTSSTRKAGVDDFQFIPNTVDLYAADSLAITNTDYLHLSANSYAKIDYGSYEGLNDLSFITSRLNPTSGVLPISRLTRLEGSEGTNGRFMRLVTDDSVISNSLEKRFEAIGAFGVGYNPQYSAHYDYLNLKDDDYDRVKLPYIDFYDYQVATTSSVQHQATPVAPSVFRVKCLNKSTGEAFGNPDYVTIKTNFEFPTTHPYSGEVQLIPKCYPTISTDAVSYYAQASGVVTASGNGVWYPESLPATTDPRPTIDGVVSGNLFLKCQPGWSATSWSNNVSLKVGCQYRVYFNIPKYTSNSVEMSLSAFMPTSAEFPDAKPNFTVWQGTIEALQFYDTGENLNENFAFGVDFVVPSSGIDEFSLNREYPCVLKIKLLGGEGDYIEIDSIRFVENAIKHGLNSAGNTEGGNVDGKPTKFGNNLPIPDFIISTYPSSRSTYDWQHLIAINGVGNENEMIVVASNELDNYPNSQVVSSRRYVSAEDLFNFDEAGDATFRFSPSKLAPRDSQGFFTGGDFDVTCTLRRLGDSVDYYPDNLNTGRHALKSECKINSIEFATNEHSHITESSSGGNLSFHYDPSETFTPPPEVLSEVSLFSQGLQGEPVTISWDFVSFTGNPLMIDFGSDGTNAIEVSGTTAGSQTVICDGDNIRLRTKNSQENRTLGSELVLNGTFNSTLMMWLFNGDAATYVSHNLSPASMHIDGLKYYNERGYVYQNVTVEEGELYALSFDYYIESGILRLDMDGADDTAFHSTSTQIWETHSHEFIARTTTAAIKFYGTEGTEVDALVDNVSLRKVTTSPATATSAVLDYIKIGKDAVGEIKVLSQRWGDPTSINHGMIDTKPYGSSLRVKTVSTLLGAELVTGATRVFTNGAITGWDLISSATNTTNGSDDYADITSASDSVELLRLTDPIAVTLGEEYEVSFDRVSGTDDIALYVSKAAGEGDFYIVEPILSSTEGNYSARFVAKNTHVRIGVRASAGSKRGLFDNVSLKQVFPVTGGYSGVYPKWSRNISGIAPAISAKIRVDVDRMLTNDVLVLKTNIGTFGAHSEYNVTSVGVTEFDLNFPHGVPFIHGGEHYLSLQPTNTTNGAMDTIIANVEIEVTTTEDDVRIVKIDLFDETDLPISLSSKDFTSISKSSGSFSKTITVPATRNNKDAVLFNGELNTLINDSYKEGIECLIQNQGVNIFQGALFLSETSLDEFGAKELSFHIKGGNSSWAEKLKRKRLRSLSSEYYTVSTRSVLGLPETESDDETQFPDETQDIVNYASREIMFPLIDNGRWNVNPLAESVNEVSVGWDNIKPAYRIVKVLEKCFSSIGYSLKSDFFFGSAWSDDFGVSFSGFINNLVGIAPSANISDEVVKASEVDLSYDYSTISTSSYPTYNTYWSNKEPSAFLSGIGGQTQNPTMAKRPRVSSFFIPYQQYHIDWAFLHFNETNKDENQVHELKLLEGNLGNNFNTSSSGELYDKIFGITSSTKSHITVHRSGYYDLNFSVKANFNCQSSTSYGTFSQGAFTGSDNIMNWHNSEHKFTVGLVPSDLADNPVYKDSQSFGAEFFDLYDESTVLLDHKNYHNTRLNINRVQYLEAGETYNVMALSGISHNGEGATPFITFGTSFQITAAEMKMVICKDIAPMRGKNNLIYKSSAKPKVSYKEILPDVSCLEFISDISKMFNLVFNTNEDSREVIVEPYRDFYNDFDAKYVKVEDNNIPNNGVFPDLSSVTDYWDADYGTVGVDAAASALQFTTSVTSQTPICFIKSPVTLEVGQRYEISFKYGSHFGHSFKVQIGSSKGGSEAHKSPSLLSAGGSYSITDSYSESFVAQSTATHISFVVDDGGLSAKEIEITGIEIAKVESTAKDWTNKALITNIKENAIIKSDLRYSMASDSSDYEVERFKSGGRGLALGDTYIETGIKVESDEEEISLDIYAPMRMDWSKFICRDAANADRAINRPIWIPRIWDSPDSNLEPDTNAQVPAPNNSHEHKLGVVSDFVNISNPDNLSGSFASLSITYELERVWDSSTREMRMMKEVVKNYLPVSSYSLIDSDTPNVTFSSTLTGNSNAKGLYNEYHKPLIEMLKMRDKLVTAEVMLTPADIAGIDFRQQIHIDGNIYILNKIKDFNFSGEPTEVELLLVTPRGTKE